MARVAPPRDVTVGGDVFEEASRAAATAGEVMSRGFHPKILTMGTSSETGGDEGEAKSGAGRAEEEDDDDEDEEE